MYLGQFVSQIVTHILIITPYPCCIFCSYACFCVPKFYLNSLGKACMISGVGSGNITNNKKTFLTKQFQTLTDDCLKRDLRSRKLSKYTNYSSIIAVRLECRKA